MFKKLLLPATALLLFLSGCGPQRDRELPIGDFKPGGKDGLPTEWQTSTKHACSGTIKTIIDPEDSDKKDYIVEFDIVSGIAEIETVRSFKAVQNADIKLDAEVHGKGRMLIGLNYYNNGKFAGCNILASTLDQWTSVQGKTNIQVTETVPVEIMNQTTGEKVVGPDSFRIFIRVDKGSKIAVEGLDAKEVMELSK